MITHRTGLHSVHKERTTELQICPDNFTPGEDTDAPCTFLEMSRYHIVINILLLL